MMGDDSRMRVIVLTADRHDPDLGFVSVKHPAGIALLGAREDEQIEFIIDGREVNWMLVKIEKRH
jgi:transcription elongation GreA/GreB family factor